MNRAHFHYLSPDSAPYLSYTDFAESPLNRNRLGGIIGMLEYCGGQPGRHSLLEIGCGIGNVSIPLASLGYRIKAIDIDEASVKETERRNVFDNLEVRMKSVEEEDLSLYDVIILSEVMEHVPEADAFFSDIVARMNPKAFLILTVPNGRGICELTLRPAYWLKSRGKGLNMIKAVRRLLGTRELTTANVQTPHLHFFTMRRLDRLSRSNALHLILFHRIFFLWALLESLFSAGWLPPFLARWDYRLSQKMPTSFGAIWMFLLQKK